MVMPSSVERGESSGLTLHVVPRNSGGPLQRLHSSSQHHLIAFLYSTVIPVVAIIIMILTTASLSAVLRSQKRTKLLHISGTCPGDGSHYYGCIRFLTCALLDYHIKLRDLQL